MLLFFPARSALIQVRRLWFSREFDPRLTDVHRQLDVKFDELIKQCLHICISASPECERSVAHSTASVAIAKALFIR